MHERLARLLTPEIKVISTTDHTVDYIASDATLDCYHEILVAKGVNFERFAKNAPFVDSHDYSTIEKLLGSVTEFGVKAGKVVERVKWAVDVSPLAALGFKLTESGHLKAVSVGFIPMRYAWKDSPEFVDMVKELKLDAETAAKCRCIHREWMQIELSACIIGANPSALAKAFQDGALRERDLAAVGFAGDREFEFLTLASQTYEQADKLQRLQIELEMQRIYRARNLSAHDTRKPQQQAPGGAAGASRQAEQRAQDNAELVAALKSIPRVTPAS